MGTILLVRHGQAEFGTADYDRLTEIGVAQSRLLGRHFARRGLRFDALFTGTLRRHAQTAEAILQEMSNANQTKSPNIECFEGLDEYNPDALVEALTGRRPTLTTATLQREPAAVREYFRILRDALMAWTEERISPEDMPSWVRFAEGVMLTLAAARDRHADGNVLIVSSGGPIAAAVAAALKAPPGTAVELNLRIRNTGVTQFTMTPHRHHLVSFNSIAHIEEKSDATLETYA